MAKCYSMLGTLPRTSVRNAAISEDLDGLFQWQSRSLRVFTTTPWGSLMQAVGAELCGACISVAEYRIFYPSSAGSGRLPTELETLFGCPLAGIGDGRPVGQGHEVWATTELTLLPLPLRSPSCFFYYCRPNPLWHSHWQLRHPLFQCILKMSFTAKSSPPSGGASRHHEVKSAVPVYQSLQNPAPVSSSHDQRISWFIRRHAEDWMCRWGRRQNYTPIDGHVRSREITWPQAITIACWWEIFTASSAWP